MYSRTRQSGRTRVNKVVDGKVLKSRHKKTQPKKDRSTPLTKLYGLQDELFKDGYTLKEYDNYIQEKINKDKYYYTCITEAEVQKLKDRYARLINKEDQHYNAFDYSREMKQKQKKLFREKKKKILHERKQELIHKCIKIFTKTSSAQSFNRVMSKLEDSKEYYYNLDNWNTTRKMLFGTGGSYLLDTDREWAKLYDLLVSEPSFKFVGCTSNKELNQYVFEN